MIKNWAVNTLFVGEDGCLPVICQENTANYFPNSWTDWTPGLSTRAQWAYKYYKVVAKTSLEKTPKELGLYYLGMLLEQVLGTYWYYNSRYNKYHNIFGFTYTKQLTRQFFNDNSSCREIKLVWRHR